MGIQLSSCRHTSDSEDVLGDEEMETDPAAQADRLFARGVREVVFEDPVLLDGGGAAARAALGLLRELGAWGVSCRWSLDGEGGGPGWISLSHLPPPVAVVNGSGWIELESWRDSYFPCKCIYREGPDFIQIRDRRSGVLERYTVDDPAFVDAVRALSCGGDPRHVDCSAVEEFVESGLLLPVGETFWWAPTRVRRWPIPAMIV